MSKPVLHIETFALGQWQTNCYVVCAQSAGHTPTGQGAECWIIDAGFSPLPMVRFIMEKGWRPTQVLLTHGHVDHIAGLHELRGHWPELGILIHEAEREALTDANVNLSALLDEPMDAPPATGLLTHNQTLLLGECAFKVLRTSGHSPGGVSFYQPQSEVAFVGDALFNGSVGRTDFPTSNHGELMRNIAEQLLTLPEATRIYPGHGPPSTIAAEKRHNPFLRR